MELELVNEDDSEVIRVFYENKPVGTVSGRYSENFEKHYLDAPELKFLPKSSAAEYYFKFGDFDIIRIDLLIIKKEIARLRLEKSKTLRKYSLSELITIIDTGNREFEEGLKFKIVKESGNKRSTDAFGVYLDGEKVGIVANRFTSKCGSTSMPVTLKNFLMSVMQNNIMVYDNYHIARII